MIKQSTILIALLIFLTSCGIEVSTDHHSSIHHDYLSLQLTYVDEDGDTERLKHECIDLDGGSDSSSIVIHNEQAFHELKINWQRRGNNFKLRFYEADDLFHNTFYATEFFRNGNTSKINLEVDGVNYRVRLSGPRCIED
jgi:hypothetical protein